MEANPKGQRLLVTARPKTDESFTSYILRLTEMNGYEKPSWILRLAGAETVWVNKSCSFVFGRSLNWAQLSAVTGMDVETLSKLVYPSAGAPNSAMAFGYAIPQYLIRPFKPKVCPQCLVEFGYCRKVWDFAFVTVCAVHQCLLLDECPGCGLSLSLVRNKVSVCRCKFDWREAICLPIDESELRIARYVHQCCGLPVNTGATSEGTGKNLLFSLNLEDFLTALFFVLGQQQGVLDTTGKFLATSRRNAELHSSLLKAVAVFDNWAINFYEFLSVRRVANSRIKIELESGTKKDFGSFHMGLYGQLSSPQFDFMRAAYQEYLALYWDGGLAPSALLNEAASRNRKYVTRKEARHILEVDFCHVDRWVEGGKLKAIVRERKKARLILIERESVAELKASLDNSVKMDGVAMRLGVGYMAALDLFRHKCIVPMCGLEIDGYGVRRFTEDAINNLLDQVRSKIVPHKLLRPRHMFNMNIVLKKLQRCRCTSGRLVRAVLDGEIALCGEIEEVGLKRFLFAKEDIAKYLDTQLQVDPIAVKAA